MLVKYIVGCSRVTCDEPVLADLGLETLKCRRDFRILNWYPQIMCMNDERLPLKLLLSSKWDKVKSKGHSRKSWLAQVNSLKKELDLQHKALNIKIIKEALAK